MSGVKQTYTLMTEDAKREMMKKMENAESEAERERKKRKELESALEESKKETERIRAALELRTSASNETAQNLIKGIFEEIEFIKTLRHDMFAPGELERLERRASQAQGDLQGGHGDAALIGARRAFEEAEKLKKRVGESEIEWGEGLLKLKNLKINAESELGKAGQACVTGSIDWSEGKLEEARKTLEGAREPETVAELAKREKEMKGLLKRIGDIIEDSCISKDRVRMLKSAEKVLEAQFLLQRVDEDFQNGKVAGLYRNPVTKNEVVVVIRREGKGSNIYVEARGNTNDVQETEAVA
ncbi:MAG: hypothetical protein LBT59_11355, partial [Clostridiales bacterium]|nr:hypothetical protein [Clostridiales bacterium]